MKGTLSVPFNSVASFYFQVLELRCNEDLDGRWAGRAVAQGAWDKAQSYFHGRPPDVQGTSPSLAR